MQEDRLAECEQMLVAMDLALWLNDGSAAVKAVVNCYSLLAPLIFHQITCDPVVQVCKTSFIRVLKFCEIIDRFNNAQLCVYGSVCIRC